MENTTESVPSILALGSVNSDAFMRLETLPREGETVTGGSLSRALGGKGANAAVAAARAGATVSFAVAVGDDAAGREALETLGAHGLNLEHAWTCPDAATGTAFILLDAKGRNSIAVAPGANFAWDAARVDGLAEAIAQTNFLLLGNEIAPAATTRALELAAQSQTPTLLNYAPVANREVPLSGAVSVLVVNESEAGALCQLKVSDVPSAQTAARALRGRGPRAVALTLGEAGVVLCDEDGVRHLAAHRVAAVDTVAAGDTFCGALAVALAQGQNLDEAARFASAAAALCVTRAGALPSIPARAEIMALLGG